MDIEITDLSSYEIITILTNYPRGKLVIKYDRIFWDSGSIEPVTKPNEAAQSFDPRQPPRVQKGNQIGKAFERMADTLGSMVC